MKKKNLKLFSQADICIGNYPDYAKVSVYQIPGMEDVSSTVIRNYTPPIYFGSLYSFFNEDLYLKELDVSKMV